MNSSILIKTFSLFVILLFSRVGAAQNTYRRILARSPLNLSPHRLDDAYSIHVLQQCVLGLLTTTDDYRIEAGVAENWSLSRDKKTYTFTIRPNLKYSDGTDFKLTDFIDSMQSVLAKDSIDKKELSLIVGAQEYSAGQAKTISGIKIRGPRTIEITISNPFPPFLSLLTAASNGIFQQKDIKLLREKKMAPFASLGPYFVSELNTSNIILKKNPYYFKRDQVFFDEIVYDLNVPEQEAIKGFSEGKYYDIYPYQIPEAVALETQALKIPTLTTMSWNIEFGLSKPHVKNLALRKFIYKHFDFDSFLQAANKPKHFKANGLIPRGLVGFDPAKKIEIQVDDNKALTASKCFETKPCYLTIKHPYPDLNEALIKGVQPINGQFKAIRIDVQLMDRQKWYQKYVSGDYSIVVAGLSPPYPDTIIFFDTLLDRNYHPEINQTEAQKYMRLSLKTESREERARYYGKVEESIFAQMPFIPLFFGDESHRYVSNKLQPFSSPLTTFNYVRIEKLRLRDEKVSL